MMGRSLVSFLVSLVFGTLMSIPYSTTWAVIIKMMRSTKTTSTKGVTLISASAVTPRPGRRLPFEPTLIATRRLLPEASFGQVEEFESEVVHARAKLFQQVTEM